MSLRTRADDLTELMDDPDCDAERLTRTLRRLAIVNRAVAAWGRVYRTLLRPAFVGPRTDPGRSERAHARRCR